MSSLDHSGKQIVKSLWNELIKQKTTNKENKEYKEIAERYKSLFDAKKNTDKKMHTQSTTEIETSLTEDRTQLDKEEPTEDKKGKDKKQKPKGTGHSRKKMKKKSNAK